MIDTHAEAIQKLKLYQQQIKEQTKIEILTLVEDYGVNYFDNVRRDQEDSRIQLINYRIETVNSIQNMITFLKEDNT